MGLAGAAAVCVAGVALRDSGLHLAWQTWRLATWAFTLCGRPGTYGSWVRGIVAVCVTGVALTALGWLWWRACVWRAPWLFAWQAWRLVTATFALRGRRGTWRTPVPSVCIHPPWSYISIKCMKGRGGRWSSPATERGVKKVCTLLLFLIE